MSTVYQPAITQTPSNDYVRGFNDYAANVPFNPAETQRWRIGWKAANAAEAEYETAKVNALFPNEDRHV